MKSFPHKTVKEWPHFRLNRFKKTLPWIKFFTVKIEAGPRRTARRFLLSCVLAFLEEKEAKFFIISPMWPHYEEITIITHDGTTKLNFAVPLQLGRTPHR